MCLTCSVSCVGAQAPVLILSYGMMLIHLSHLLVPHCVQCGTPYLSCFRRPNSLLQPTVVHCLHRCLTVVCAAVCCLWTPSLPGRGRRTVPPTECTCSLLCVAW